MQGEGSGARSVRLELNATNDITDSRGVMGVVSDTKRVSDAADSPIATEAGSGGQLFGSAGAFFRF